MNNVNKEKNQYLLKNTAIFAVGNFASKFISFFLVPLYTHCMVATEYGKADLLYTVCNFLVPLFTLNIAEAVLRFSLDNDANQNKIIRIATSVVPPLMIFGLILIPILNLFDGYGQYALYFYAYMVTTASSQIFLMVLKGQEKLKLYTLGNVLHTLLIGLLNIVFLLVMKMNIEGYFLAYIVSNLLVTIYAIHYSGTIRRVMKSTFDKQLFKKMTKYSVVLIPTTFMWWIMNFVDRIMIAGMIDVSASGIYAVSYKIPTILSSVSSIFMQAWLFSAIKNSGKDDNEKYSNTIFRMLGLILMLVSMPLMFFVKQFFSVYVAPEYYMAWEYVPSLMVGHIFLTLSTFISTSYNVNKDSGGLLRSATIGAIANIALNAILIPPIGVQGAALATTISYIIVFIYRMFDTKKYLKMHFTARMFFSSLTILAVSVALFLPSIERKIIEGISLVSFICLNVDGFKALFGTTLSSVTRIIKREKKRGNKC